VKEYQDRNIARVEHAAQYLIENMDRTKADVPARRSVIREATGRRYTFVEKDSPSWKKTLSSFSPTQIKNYPVQGFATGDIVPLVLGAVYRWLVNSGYGEECLLINTIHDSIMFDCATVGHAEQLAPVIAKIMQSAPFLLKQRFGIDFNIPLKVEAKYGRNWGEMEKLELDI